MNSREQQHEYFEELCALAALGQISPEEYRELRAHLQICGACRVRTADFTEILHEHLPILDSQKPMFANAPNVAFHDASYKLRFLRRAEKEGIRFSGKVLGKRKPSLLGWDGWHRFSWVWQPRRLAYSVLLLGLGVWIGLLSAQKPEVPPDRSAQLARLQGQIFDLRQRIVELSQSSSTLEHSKDQMPRSSPAAALPAAPSPNPLQRELVQARRDYSVALARSQQLEEQLSVASTELAALKDELSQTLKKEEPVSVKLRETESALRQASEGIQKLQRERAVYASTFADQQTQIRELMDELGTQRDVLQREKELTATTREIRELMGARNLHIIDVADFDSRGAQRPFGRVFYTEGKSLIFYAYDLENSRKSLEKYSFQAWGQKESRNASAQSLGVFVADDQAQSRWVLKYDDPKVLTQIDSVFVTIEPKGGSDRPQGRQLMYAYLRANPNHP